MTKIKKLVWRGPWAETPYGCYKIEKIETEPMNGPGSPRSPMETSYRPWFNGQMFAGGIFGTADRAREACQKHLEKNVRAMLEDD